MISEVPNLDPVIIARHAKELYGIEGNISPLVSFEDQNALISTADTRYVFKIANRRWPIELLQMQHQVMLHLESAAPQLAFPMPLKSHGGDILTQIEGFNAYMLSYLEGEMYAQAIKSQALYRDAGRFLGQFSHAMQGFSHPASQRQGYLWNLDNVISCRAYIEDIVDADSRDRIARLFIDYETNIAPKLSGLRKAVIHGDANEQNFIVDADRRDRMYGLIDFGDISYSSQINELAIALAYLLLGEVDIGAASKMVIDGYCNEFSLADNELAVVFDLVAMRLATSIVMSSNEEKKHPGNSYILISQIDAQALLQLMEIEKYILK